MKTIIQIATNDPEQLLSIWEQLPDARVGGDVTAAGNPMILVDLTTPPGDDEHDLDGPTITTVITPATIQGDVTDFATALEQALRRLASSPVEEVSDPSPSTLSSDTSSGPHDDDQDAETDDVAEDPAEPDPDDRPADLLVDAEPADIDEQGGGCRRRPTGRAAHLRRPRRRGPQRRARRPFRRQRARPSDPGLHQGHHRREPLEALQRGQDRTAPPRHLPGDRLLTW